MSETAVVSAIDRLHEILRRAAPGGPTVVTLGKFDGVHLGHRALVDVAGKQAARVGATPGVLTFDPLPFVVFNPGRPYHYLCSIDDRVGLLEKTGAKFVVVLPFDRDLSQVTAREFVIALRDSLGMIDLVVGPDAALGHDREGTVGRLRELGAELGFTLTEVAPVVLNGEPVKSSMIRRHVYAGEMAEAAAALGRPYSLTGVVVGGDRRGRELGYPTANLRPPEHLVVPADGVYGCRAIWAGGRRTAAVSIGVRPTFGSGLQRLIEAHLLDFNGDLYSETLRLEFVHRVRGEERFDSAEALIARMAADVEEIRRVVHDES